MKTIDPPASAAVSSFQFSKGANAPDSPPDILGGRSPEEFLKSKYQRGCIFGLDCLQNSACYRYLGWQFNFRPFLKRYLVRQSGCGWVEYYAPSKTALRASLYGRISEIIAA